MSKYYNFWYNAYKNEYVTKEQVELAYEKGLLTEEEKTEILAL